MARGRAVAEAHAFVDFERLGELFGDLQVGIQAGHGILKDHGDAVAADLRSCFSESWRRSTSSKRALPPSIRPGGCGMRPRRE